MHSRYRFSTSSDEIDRVVVHGWLSEQSYWAKGRTREAQDAAIDASRNYGIFEVDSGAQVAYARVITDGVTFAWLCDVFVATTARGNNLGKDLIAGVVADLEPLGLRRVLLATADAHGLYEKYDFGPLPEPDRFMVRLQPTT
ncbi:GNAT superfamily N-acetyltransferase [Microbacterium endophyticum]|uniref:GNAT superfamily N-acetyltransferase n=1 Tax=Microbacterium endophyticum TaxID=1526412 RepID=A0A7W4YL74_9MICO|nr:GNAT family N-acetyltransferase [Microbacterium endophyticum]MBB2975160.1 GNAT superfamily N-acetyltransferase [Microbacterium endophyticum]NIK37300.1 GNAT superfamily N-acetyltransferase [Microbacterium endophyticum]